MKEYLLRENMSVTKLVVVTFLILIMVQQVYGLTY